MPKKLVLLLEDSEDDIELIKKSFERVGFGYPLAVMRSTDQAKKYLKGEMLYADRSRFPFPALILLDLKMPGEDGFDFLGWLRAQPEFRNLPVVALTASDQMKDVNRAYQLGANSFLVKPHDFDNFVETSRLLQQYWLELSWGSGAGERKRESGT
jgi:CheY-like chemotaxis protein